MAQAGYDFFIGEPNSGETRQCRVCGSACRIVPNVYGSTGFMSTMAKRFAYHDEFVCPHTDNAWHEHALRLAIAIDETPSKSIAKMMRDDLADLLRENLS
jgi:uncharacterized protein YbcC (UPF0753/DUF2309 family)